MEPPVDSGIGGSSGVWGSPVDPGIKVQGSGALLLSQSSLASWANWTYRGQGSARPRPRPRTSTRTRARGVFVPWLENTGSSNGFGVCKGEVGLWSGFLCQLDPLGQR